MKRVSLKITRRASHRKRFHGGGNYNLHFIPFKKNLYFFNRKIKMKKLHKKVVPSSECGNDGCGGGEKVGIMVTQESEMCGRRLPSVSHGSVSICGRMRVMEHAVMVVPGLGYGYDFFAVYGGHAGSGVANICRDRLHKVLVKEIQERLAQIDQMTGDELIDWENVLVSSFLKMDEEVSGVTLGIEDDEDMKPIGSTAVVALVGRDKIIVANCGNSRAVLSHGGIPIALSSDHTLDRSDELERIEAVGGSAITWNGNPMLRMLATSRSIGDRYLKQYVISIPEVTITSRSENDEFLILASNGLWDVLSNEVACDVSRGCLQGRFVRRCSSYTSSSRNDAADVAAMLVELAIAKGSKDNISVIVIELKKN